VRHGTLAVVLACVSPSPRLKTPAGTLGPAGISGYAFWRRGEVA
jgi:hypothetical protein